ncbi:MAG: sel1 repeat family protein [Bacteroidales bacterium]|nr:sel1 repeat family protein [Bacteroidales bacterium]
MENLELLKKQAEEGDANAQYSLGTMYFSGWGGVQKDYKELIKWLTKASEQGHAMAQWNLGVCFEKGYGVKINYEKAEGWYLEALKNGCDRAKNNLTDLYNKGLVVPRNAPRKLDDTFGELVYFGESKIPRWKVKTTSIFGNKKCNFFIELQGFENENITDAQYKAYAEYLEKKDAFFDEMKTNFKKVYKVANNSLPILLYIDREGNYGWIYQMPGNKNFISIILSDGDIKFGTSPVLYLYKDILESRTKSDWKIGDFAYINLFGVLKRIFINRADNDEFSDEGDEDFKNGKLTDEELKLLLWLLNALDKEDFISDDVLKYCNNSYKACGHAKIKKNELHDEIQPKSIYFCTRFTSRNKYYHMPEISITGECKCDADHGIAICFRDGKLIDIGSEDFAGF